MAKTLHRSGDGGADFSAPFLNHILCRKAAGRRTSKQVKPRQGEGSMEKIKIGQIVNAVALKGEVKVYNYSGYKERYEELKDVFVDDTRRRIEGVRYQNNVVILKLSGIDDRDAAEAAKGSYIYITEEDLPELPEDTFYIRDLIGMDVETAEGLRLGRLSDVLQNSAQDLYEVEREDGRKLLIPAVAEFILDIDKEKRLIKVHLIEGMLDL